MSKRDIKEVFDIIEDLSFKISTRVAKGRLGFWGTMILVRATNKALTRYKWFSDVWLEWSKLTEEEQSGNIKNYANKFEISEKQADERIWKVISLIANISTVLKEFKK